MAEFKYINYECELKFGDNEYKLPLNEQTADLIEKQFHDKTLPEFKSIEEINDFYNQIMDSIDELLGEGAASDIMSRFAHPGTMEIMSVVNYIVSEWSTQYKTVVEEMKKTADIPNRETRRATKGGRR
jgi:hypothetical protein